MRTAEVTTILKAVRPDLLTAMRMLDRDQIMEAHLRLAMCVSALDDAITELG